MNKDLISLPMSRTWRDIPQHVRPRAMSPEGRRRMTVGLVRAGAGIMAAVVCAWVAWELALVVRNQPGGILASANAHPVRPPILLTDGVLDNRWLARTLSLPKGSTLMSLDMIRLRERVLANGQIASAALVKHFPDTLEVRISERAPVGRILAQVGKDAPRTLLVARDGVVFEGWGFDGAMLESLPYLGGIKLIRQGGGFAPLSGIAPAVELMAMAKLEADTLYQSWKAIDLSRLSSDGEIEVLARDGMRAIFSANGSYLRQLARLNLLCAAAAGDPTRTLRVIDLALGSDVPVTYGPPNPAVSASH